MYCLKYAGMRFRDPCGPVLNSAHTQYIKLLPFRGTVALTGLFDAAKARTIRRLIRS